MSLRKFDGREAIGEIILGPLDKFRRVLRPSFDGLLEHTLSFYFVQSVEDRTDAYANGFELIKAANLGLGTLLQFRLTALTKQA